MPGLIGKKIGMTSIFSEEGKNIPCTILEVGPCKVTQVKTKEVEGIVLLFYHYDQRSSPVESQWNSLYVASPALKPYPP